MICYYCEFQFCWICGGTYSKDHYSSLNPFGCAGMQFKLGEPALTWWGTTKLYVKRVLMAVGLVIFGPIALLFLLPFGLCYLFIEKTK